MFDWLRRHDETGQVVVPEQKHGNPMPARAPCRDSETVPEPSPAATPGLSDSGDAGVEGPRDQTRDAEDAREQHQEVQPSGEPGRSGEVEPKVHARGGSEINGAAEPIGSQAVPTPPLSGRGAARRSGRRLVKPEQVERARRGPSN